MNILHINQSESVGGAAIAGYRLHQSLLHHGLDSRLLVGTVETDDSRVAPVPRRYSIESLLYRITHRLGLNTLNMVGSFDIAKHPFFQEADVLNFHNLHSSRFSYLAISKLTQHKPAVFTLHDMWSFTGHCAYSYDCNRWQIGCGHCPYPEVYPAIRRDNTQWEWKLKDWIYSRSNLTIVTPSHWLTRLAKASMLNRFSVHCIPYGIDTEAYQPLDPELCRHILGIPLGKKVLLFSAVDLKDTRKGGALLVKILRSLPESLKQDCFLLTFGMRMTQLEIEVEIPALHLGYLSSDRIKSIVYSAADLFIFPTLSDNLPLVLQESMACSTPMVSFKIGGVPDLVRPGITGYLAQSGDAENFSNGIIQLLEDHTLRQQMRTKCRQIALAEYSLSLQAQRYINLYKQILN